MVLALLPPLHIRAHTMLQQLQNLTSDDIIHGYQTCPLVAPFSENWCLNGCNVSFAESRVEDYLELKFKYVDYQTLAQHPTLQLLCLLSWCWTSVCAA